VEAEIAVCFTVKEHLREPGLRANGAFIAAATSRWVKAGGDEIRATAAHPRAASGRQSLRASIPWQMNGLRC
jgi:hypothetical protein